ncbi:mercuric reductase [Flavobacterium psychroterrae]|uniref:Mercuric reductase n=1 Tax=Flavobacterium psychroterrae TaxID=2133767 RepID=A0ABS5PHZ6_9FLAO|nr:mercuric reductase [Flavobacterium psychroterrae]MBS7233455.1 mercuric reductase [Flavobacterium psychroterrae]
MENFDYIVIGSGQAGIPLVFSLAKQGKVALVEKSFLGGTCVNNGCTPTKAYVASARRMWDALHGDELGIEIPCGAKANLEKIKARKDKLVHESRSGIEKGISNNEQITLYRGEAHFLSNYQVQVGETILTAKNIFINVGARAVVPSEYQDIPFYTNENILELTDLPEHLIIVGGSYIGLEFGQMFSRFGSKVTIVERNGKLINREDQTVSDAVAEIMSSDGVNLLFNAVDIKVKGSAGEISLTVDGSEIKGSHLLLAIGRSPNTDTLQLGNTSIEVNNKNYIKVNDYCQTNVEGVFAIGDCNGEGAFTHTSYNDFQIVESFLLKENKRKISDRISTYGLFIDPPLGRIGMTKKEAIDKGYEVLVAYRPMSKISRAKEKGETLGFMEAVIDAKTNLFLGACIIGVGGDEIINGITNLMYAKKPYTMLRDSVHIHPTVSELIPTMLENLKPIDK